MSGTFTLLKAGFLFSATLIIQPYANAGTFTAVASGNYSSGASWQGGIAPPFNITGDTVVIPSGISVTLNNNISIAGLNSGLTVNGQLSGTSNTLDFNGIPISGSGKIEMDSISGAFAGSMDFGGTVNTNKLNISFSTVTGNPTINVGAILYVHSSMGLDNGSIHLLNNAKIVIKGTPGIISPPLLDVSSPGKVVLSTPYSVEYMNGSIETGTELSGAGLNGIKIDVGSTDEVKMTSDLTITTGTLLLSSGILNLNNNNLEFSASGDLGITGQGAIRSTSGSDITVNRGTPLSGTLNFVQGGNTVGSIVINTTGTVNIGSDLKVANTVSLQSGKLGIQTNKLSLIAGATVTGADNNRYIVTDGGGSLADDVGSGDTVTYHIGTQSHYAPCIITSKNNTVYNGLAIGVNEGVKNMGTTGKLISDTQPLVNATWFLDGTSSNIDVDVELLWEQGMEKNSFDRAKSYLSQLMGATWDKQTAQQANISGNMYKMRREGVKFFTPMAVFDETTVGIDNLAAQNRVKVYPNPANDIVYVESTGRATAIIYNTAGQIVYQGALEDKLNSINISQLQQGVYYIHLKGSTLIAQNKFMKY